MFKKLFKLFKKEEIISQEKVWDISEPITTLINLATLHPERFSCKVKGLDNWTECCTIKYKPKDIVLNFTTHNTGFGLAFNCKSNTLTQDNISEVQENNYVYVKDCDVSKFSSRRHIHC